MLNDTDRHLVGGLLAGKSLVESSAELGKSGSWGTMEMALLRARFDVPSTAALIAKLTTFGQIVVEDGVCRVVS